MEHLTSFTLGTGFGLLIAFLTGFFTKAGEHGCNYLIAKIFPQAPAPAEVDSTFEPDMQYYGRCSWIGEDKLSTCLEKGYTYYKYGQAGGKCFRYSSSARNHKEFLMHQSDSI